MVKNLPAMQETWVQSLGQEDPLEKEMATHSSILAWRIPWTEESGGLQSIESQRVGHDWATELNWIRWQIWKTQQWTQGWKRSVFITIPKKGNVKECSNYRTITLISHASKVMLKILQARLQQYVNRELPDVQAGLRKGRGNRDQLPTSSGSLKKQESFQKNIYFCFIDYIKAFDCVDHNKVWKIPKEMGIPDHLTCLLRNLYAGQEATVRTGHGMKQQPGSKLGKEYVKAM